MTTKNPIPTCGVDGCEKKVVAGPTRKFPEKHELTDEDRDARQPFCAGHLARAPFDLCKAVIFASDAQTHRTAYVKAVADIKAHFAAQAAP